MAFFKRRGREQATDLMIAAQARIAAQLGSEMPAAKGLVWDLQMGRRSPAWLVVTDTRVLWSWLGEYDGVMESHFRFMHDGTESEQPLGFALLTRDPNASMPGNPLGEMVAQFEVPPNDQGIRMLAAVRNGVQRHSPRHSPTLTEDEYVQRLRAVQGTAVPSMDKCPFCGKPFYAKTDHAAHCFGCAMILTDPGFQPDVQEDDDDGVRLIGDKRWLPILESDIGKGLEDRTRAWIARPPGARGPLVLPAPFDGA